MNDNRLIQMSSSDTRLDQDSSFRSLNPLPIKCPVCGFPDLDYIAQPYFLSRGRSRTPAEIQLAEVGNFLVREKTKNVIDYTCPGTCEYYRTNYLKSDEVTPWWLAVPLCQVETAFVVKSVPRCEVCGEPRMVHPGTQFEYKPWSSDSDICKSKTWGSSSVGWDHDLSRRLFFSVRLFQLLKKLKLKGFDQVTSGSPTPLTKPEKEWIVQQVELLSHNGIISDPSLNGDATKDFVIPKTYVHYIASDKPTRFSDYDDLTGAFVQILPPDKLDLKNYRKGKANVADDESRAVDAVIFAVSGHGDCFGFDVAQAGPEYPVVQYEHEISAYTPYADNFTACVERWSAH